MNREEVLKTILEKKIIVIVRGTYGDSLKRLADALYKGGARLMEVTFEQNKADCIEKTTQAISMLNSQFGGKLYAGAGTVLNKEQVQAAYDAGAAYTISPNINKEVIETARKLGMVSIPGAMTPSEILQGHDWGGDVIKLFPAGTLGEKYVKDILAPITHVKILATGGITEENFARYLDLGLCGAGISGRLTDKKLIAAGDWDEFTSRMKAFASIAER